MRKPLLFISFFFILLNIVSWKKAPPEAPSTAPTVIGVEYTFPGMAKAFSDAGLKGVKYFPDIYEWGDMQKKAGGAIDFSETDRYVKEYEDAGFTSLLMSLRSRCDWGSKDGKGMNPKNLAPKPEYADQYKKWIAAVVERYDNDGKDDMPGLKTAVQYYEIGTEFSTYEPESVDEYIAMLGMAYQSAHAAFPNVKILHVALLTTTAVTMNTTAATVDNGFATAAAKSGKRILYHSLADIRKLYDHPEIFDVANFHSCGDPFEIEGIVRWLKSEMEKRGYSKPLLISDTMPTSLIGWGDAIDCNKPAAQLGIMIPPMTEDDRCKVAQVFQKVLENDSATIKWMYGFLCNDVVKKCVVAADMHVLQINTAFAEDLFWLKLKVMKAGAGTSAWSGMLETKADAKTNVRTVTGYRPMYYALKQVNEMLRDYQSIERVKYDDPHIRVYRLVKNGSENFIVWYEPDKILLPGEQVEKKTIRIKTSAAALNSYNTAQSENELSKSTRLSSSNGEVTVNFASDRPVFLR